jgi:hypothetical protein
MDMMTRFKIILLFLIFLLLIGSYIFFVFVPHGQAKVHPGIQVEDSAGLSCWLPDCKSSLAPIVDLSWDSSRQQYVVNTDLMKQPAPTPTELSAKIAYFSAHPTGYIDNEGFWGYALSLVYTGNAASAEKYLDAVWPALTKIPPDDTQYDYSDTDESAFKKGVMLDLKESPYYQAILELNGGRIF